MKRNLRRVLAALLLVAGLGLLVLTNSGILSLGRPFIGRYSADLPAAAKVMAFVDVDIVAMENEQVLRGQTVLLRDGAIDRIGASGEVDLPTGALVVDGSGRYLMPGLVDMHVHVQHPNDLLLFVANGVTTVRNMWGMTGASLSFGLPDQLALRNSVGAGDLLGPTIYTAGPVMEGQPKSQPMMQAFTAPAQALESVDWQVAQGYDFVKVYDHLDARVYRAIVAAAQERGIPVVGHVPFAVGLEEVLDSGQVTIEHLAGYIDPDAAEFLITVDELNAYAARTREAGVWNVPTLSLYPKNNVSPQRLAELEGQPGLQYLSPGRRALNGFMYAQMSKGHTYRGDDYPERIAALNLTMTHALHRAGAGILLGTDALNPYQLPGFSAHEELASLVQAGLSPYEALRAATHDAALALGRLEEIGTVAEGKRADLLLLDANPLDEVANAGRLSGVVLAGRWLPADELQSMLDGLNRSFAPTPLERLWPLVLMCAAVLIWRRGFVRARHRQSGGIMTTRVTENMNAASATARYAGFGRRLIAALLDYLIILGYIVVLLGVGFGVRAVVGPLERISPLFASPVVMDGVAFLTLTLPVGLYFALQEGSPGQATWGKRKAGIRVVDADGHRLTLARSLVRTLVKLLPWQIAHTSIFHVTGWPLAAQQPTPLVMAGFVLVYALVGIYALSAAFSKTHRTPYDRAAGAFVVVDTR